MSSPVRAKEKGVSAKREPKVPLFDEVRCKQCGICTTVCTPGAITWQANRFPVVDSDLCTSCRNCELICPDFAIVMSGEEVPPPSRENAAGEESGCKGE